MSLLSLRSLSRRFGPVTAVDRLDLDIEQGAFVTLLGPSGCGKTTTLNLIAGFETPDEGDVLLAGKRINDQPPYRRELNTVFQGYALFPHLDVAGNVAFGLRMRRTPKADIRARVAETLDMVQLGEYASRPVDRLSGGQQQRVALARALVNRPQLVLLDEPLSALDAQLRKSMQIELKRIQRDVGITFVYVTHDQEEALVMSDLVCVMNGGRVEQYGPPRELYEKPRSLFVAKFIGRNNFLPARVVEGRRLIVADAIDLVFPSALPVAGDAVLAVRPERLALRSEAGPRRLAGTVRDLRFLGDRVEVEVEVDGGSRLSVYANGRPVDRSDRVYVEIPDHEHCRVLAKEQA